VLNTFVIFLARIIGGIVDRTILRNDRQDSGIGFFLTTMLAQSFGINTGSSAGFMQLFMSHPPLDERIAALKT
jgi:Zn-dependent protease with chaperone function